MINDIYFHGMAQNIGKINKKHHSVSNEKEWLKRKIH